MNQVNMKNVSTSQITSLDKTLLNGNDRKPPTKIIPHENGWWVSVPKLHNLSECALKLYGQGYSHSFVEMLAMASEKGFWWISLETDLLGD